MPEPFLKVRALSKFYGRKIVLNSISFDINRGEIFGIIGASGSGKTTILNSLIGYLRPERGDVLFRSNKSFHSTTASAFKPHYGFASQLPSYYKKLTVRENMAYFGSLYGLSSQAISRNTTTLLSLLDLSSAEHLLAEKLSGGMERRLDIACALIHAPEILFLDEPTADLDPSLCDHIYSLIKAINKRGTTIVISSHHLIDMERLCTRVALISAGTLLEIGSPEEIIQKHTVGESILIETYPGDYQKLLTHLSGLSITIQGHRIRISTKNAATALQQLLSAAEKAEESIIDLSIVKPTLEDAFITIIKP
jgi:ABC-2 type transport system ATP-binding protein